MLKRRGRTLRNAERPSSGHDMLVMAGDIAMSTPCERVKSLEFSLREATRSHAAGDFMAFGHATNRVGALLRSATVPQFFVFGLCGAVDRNVDVGVAPEIEKGLVGAVCRRDVIHRALGSRELKPRERTDHPSSDQATPEQHFLKLRRGCAGITRPKVRQSSKVGGIERLKHVR